MEFLLTLISLVPCVVNLSFSVWVGFCFRRYPRPPLWIIVFLLIFGIGTLGLLFNWEISQFFVVLLTVLSAIFCIAMAIALSCRRWLGSSLSKSWVIAALMVLPPSMWVDYRFRITVVDGMGRPVKVDAKSINFHRPNTFWKDFRYGYGTALKKGVVYFGFCQWVMFRENWTIFGAVGEAQGDQTTFSIGNPEWNKWPIRLTVKTP